MAYMSQEKKKALMPIIKQVAAAYDVKLSVAVRHHMTLVVTLKSSSVLDFSGDNGINHHWLESNFSGMKLDFLKALFNAINEGNHNNSDIMTDYFDVGWYTEIKIGSYKKPFVFTGKKHANNIIAAA